MQKSFSTLMQEPMDCDLGDILNAVNALKTIQYAPSRIELMRFAREKGAGGMTGDAFANLEAIVFFEGGRPSRGASESWGEGRSSSIWINPLVLRILYKVFACPTEWPTQHPEVCAAFQELKELYEAAIPSTHKGKIRL